MDKIIFFATLVVFPFGQLFKFGMFNLFDALVLLLAFVTLFKKPKYPEWYKYFSYFLVFCLFGLAINSSLVDIKAFLYLIRLWSYSMVAVYVYFNNDKSTIHNLLIGITLSSAVFGWVQYLIWPDLTSLKYLGWDDHLLRMVGTFLDPTYLGLILVLGIILASQKYKNIVYLLLISLAFTYSRSSYLIASLFLLFKRQYVGLIIFIVAVLLLPKMIGEGTTLTRTASANNKLDNYKETWQVIKESPVVGVGFNNLCKAKLKYLGNVDVNSHACSGADSSTLFLLATTGVLGLILFINFILRIEAGHLLKTSMAVVLLHSVFANSLFYPHIMFWLFVLVGLGSKSNSKGNNRLVT